MATLKDELASLKIDHEARGGGGRRGGLLAFVVLVLVVGAAGGWFWTQRAQAATVKIAVVTAATGAGRTPGAVLNASGYVTARRRATVSSKVTGKVLEVFVEEGKAVKKGQVLARLDDSQVRAALAVAQAQLTTTRAVPPPRIRRGCARPSGSSSASPSSWRRRSSAGRRSRRRRRRSNRSRRGSRSRRSRSKWRSRRSRRSRSTSADMVVRAPFDGVAISKDAQPGEMISPISAGGGFTRTGIGTIVDMSSLEIEVDVSESYINRVRPEQPVEAVLDAYPDWRIPGHVITTVPTADRQKATVKVRIGFERLDPRILPDMGVKVSFLNERQAANRPTRRPAPRLLVPKSAVRTDGEPDHRLRRPRRSRGAARGEGAA